MLESLSANLSMPFLVPSQAQKHVTHNEALAVLDALVQLTVADRGLLSPPASAVEGDRHIVPAGGAANWNAPVGTVAMFINNGWLFSTPRPGWRAYVQAEERMVIWLDDAWQDLTTLFRQLAQLGINTSADDTNRLAVSAAATLLSHAGGGHQLKINKAAAVDTASLLFQSNWSGRTEMGLAGNDDFSIKVSPDGVVWADGLRVKSATGQVQMDRGLVVTSPDSGPAIRFAETESTGLRRVSANSLAVVTAGTDRIVINAAGAALTGLLSGTAVTQTATDTTAGRVLRVGAGFQQLDASLYRRGNAVGTVAQTGGVPTGAVIERGGNANGDFVRYADGTQICFRVTQAISTGPLAITWPAAFIASPVVTASPVTNVAAFGQLSDLTATSANVHAFNLAGARTAGSVSWVAIGRWF